MAEDPPGRLGVPALAAFVLAWIGAVAASALSTSHPLVLADEAFYLLPTLYGYTPENFARWQVVPQVPSLLYFGLYGAFAGPNLFLAAKLLNAFFLGASALPAYGIARRYLSPTHAACFAALVVAAPIASFARYFMPECLFYFGFWCAVYVLVRCLPRSPMASSILAGVACGALSLVKPHATALAAGFALFFLVRAGPWGAKARCAAMVVLWFVVVRLLLGYLFSQQWQLSPGPAYGAVLVTVGLDPTAVVVNVLGHFAALVLLAGLPLAALLAVLRREGDDLTLLALCVLASLLAMTLYFSYVVVTSNPGVEKATRLYGRYYAYALPLVVLAYAALAVRGGVTGRLRSDRALLAWLGTAAFATYLLATRYETTIIDYVELLLVSRSLDGLAASSAAIAATALAIRALPRPLLPIAWFAAVSVTTSLVLLTTPLTGRHVAPTYVDRAMMDIAELRALVGRHDGMVVGTPATSVDTYRVLFHLRSMSRGHFVPAAGVLRREDVPSDVAWLLLMPGAGYSGPGGRQAAGPLMLLKLR